MDQLANPLGDRFDHAARWRAAAYAIHCICMIGVSVAVLVPRLSRGFLLPPNAPASIAGRASFAYVPVVLVAAWPLLASWIATYRNFGYGCTPSWALSHIVAVVFSTILTAGLQLYWSSGAYALLAIAVVPIAQAVLLIALASRTPTVNDV